MFSPDHLQQGYRGKRSVFWNDCLDTDFVRLAHIYIV